MEKLQNLSKPVLDRQRKQKIVKTNMKMEAKTIKECIEICNKEFGVEFEKATVEQDCTEVTDIIAPSAPEVGRVSLRARHYTYLKQFAHDFTLREYEIPKILDGYGMFILYGWINDYDHSLYRWFMGNLEVFRQKYPTLRRRKWIQSPTDRFKAYTYDIELGPEFVVTRGGNWPTQNYMLDDYKEKTASAFAKKLIKERK